MIVIRKSQIKELEKKRRISNLKMLLSGILLGAAIGSIIAILLTPYEGKEVRGKIGSKAGSLTDKCKSLFGGCCDSIYCCSCDTEDEETIDEDEQ